MKIHLPTRYLQKNLSKKVMGDLKLILPVCKTTRNLLKMGENIPVFWGSDNRRHFAFLHRVVYILLHTTDRPLKPLYWTTTPPQKKSRRPPPQSYRSFFASFVQDFLYFILFFFATFMKTLDKIMIYFWWKKCCFYFSIYAWFFILLVNKLHDEVVYIKKNHIQRV